MLDLSQPGPARHQPRQFGFGAVGRAVVDVDDLEAGPLPSAAAISATSGAILPASLRTGTTTETAGGAALAKVSLMIVACPPAVASADGASFLWADKLPGNPFDPLQRRPRHAAGPCRRRRSRSRARAPRTSRAPASAPNAPTTAPAITSLGKCAVSTTRLTRDEHAHRSTAAAACRGHSAPIAIGGREGVGGVARRQAGIFDAPATAADSGTGPSCPRRAAGAADQPLRRS